MRTVSMIAALALAGMAGQAEGGEKAELSVTVYIQNEMGDVRAGLAVSLAQGIASSMFATAGVRINWRTGQPKLYQPDKPVLIDVTTNTPAAFHRGALAYAQLFGTAHIRVFYDRVEEGRGPNANTMLLAHVFVHEITHILQDVNRHSQVGVMKAKWTDNDLMEMAHKPLPFDPIDVWWIHVGLAHRSRNIETVPAAHVAAPAP